MTKDYFGPDTPNGKFIAEIKAVNDPMEALKTLNENWEFLGNDPYYREFDYALREMVERVVENGRR